MDIDSLIGEAVNGNKRKQPTKQPIKQEEQQRIQTSNTMCNVIEALGYLDMNETKGVATVIHNSILQKDIERKSMDYIDRIAKVFNYFLKSRNGSKKCIRSFNYYFIVHNGTKVSLRDLLYISSCECKSSLGKIVLTLDNINKGLIVNPDGMRVVDVYGNSLSVAYLVKLGGVNNGEEKQV